MNWSCCSTITMAGLLTAAALPSYSAQIVYGFDQASRFQKKSAGEYYIQAGSFSNLANATRAQSTLKRTLNRPVFIKQRNSYYTVVIGPVRSAAEVRSIGSKMGAYSTMPPRVHRPVAMPPVQHAVVPRHQERPVYHAPARHAPPPPTIVRQKEVYKEPLTVASIDMPPMGWFVGAELGWAGPELSDSNNNYAPSGMPGFPYDRYDARRIENNLEYSIMAGYQWRRNANFIPAYSLALSYGGFSKSSLHGVIFENNLLDSKNFEYKFNVWQQLAMLKLKVDLYRWRSFMPYVSAGAGAAFNHVSGYEQWPIPGATLQHKRFGFSSSTTTQFAGVVGAGLDYWINSYAQLSLGYQFTSTGTIRTGFGQSVLGSSRLSNKLYTNSVGLQGVYFLDL